MKRCMLAWLLVACGGGAGGASRDPGGSIDGIAQRYPDVLALYGGEHGIYRSCAPNEGVCHNDREYPDLATLGGVLQTVGARCNRAREMGAELHDLCEAAGDVVEVGQRRAQVASISYPGDRDATQNGFDALLDGYVEEIWIETERPLPVRAGELLTLRRFEGERARAVGTLRVARPRVDRHRNTIAAVVEYDENGEPTSPRMWPLREGDPNHNGVFGASLQGGLVVPGAPERSYLVRRLVDPSAGPLMPRANCCTWTKASLRATWCWIAGLEPDGSNALDPIDYEHCPEGPEEAVAYPKPGPSCATSGRCPVTARVELEGGATWEAVHGLLASRCGAPDCHGPGSTNGLQLAGDAQARTSVDAFVVPGDPARSELYRRITPDLAEASAVELMPLHGNPLPLRERELVRAFIAGMATDP